jgi:foldase protein PrsA
MQDASQPQNTGSASKRGKNKSAIIVAGTVILVLAGAVGMQLMRAQPGKAAAAPDTDVPDAAALNSLNQPLSRVNGQSITYAELAKECIERHGREVLENVINRTIIQQACADAGVTVSEAEVNQEIVKISKKFGLPVDQWYKMLQAERGLTPLQYHRDVIWPMLALKKLAGKEVEITREMMREAYVDNYGPRVQARMIVLDNLRRAQEVWDKVHSSPEEFENFARDYSVETNSKALGGRVPPIRRYSGAHEEIRKAAFKLKEVGEVSGILQVDNQYVILQFDGRTEPVEHDPKDVEAQLHQELIEREVQKLVAETFQGLKDNARVDNFLTGESTGPIEQVSASATASGQVDTAAVRQ